MNANPDGYVFDQLPVGDVRAREPENFTSTITAYLARADLGPHVRQCLEAMRDSHDDNQARRRRVLAHDDLRNRVTDLGYQRATDWNGYVPPRYGPDDDMELCRFIDKIGSVRLNQNGQRSIGTQQNDTQQRAALVTICAEAMQRGS